MCLFQQPDGFFVDGRAADADVWRRPEPVKDARLLATLTRAAWRTYVCS